MPRESDGKLVLIDFGAVKEAATVDKDGTTSLVDPSVIIGTRGYLPPEQEMGMPGKYSDIYTVGMLGIQALTGLPSMSLPRYPDELDKVLTEQQIEISPNLKAFLCKAIANQPKNRYPNATKALQALIPTEINPDIPPTKKTFPKKLILGALSAVIAGGVGTVLFLDRKPNYAQLESSLQAQDWQQADAETDKIILQIAKRDNALDAASINEFPCEPLKKIDDL